MAQLVERWTGDLRVASLKLAAGGVTVLCPSALHHNGSIQKNRKSSQHIGDWHVKLVRIQKGIGGRDPFGKSQVL